MKPVVRSFLPQIHTEHLPAVRNCSGNFACALSWNSHFGNVRGLQGSDYYWLHFTGKETRAYIAWDLLKMVPAGSRSHTQAHWDVSPQTQPVPLRSFLSLPARPRLPPQPTGPPHTQREFLRVPQEFLRKSNPGNPHAWSEGILRLLHFEGEADLMIIVHRETTSIPCRQTVTEMGG